MSRYCFIAVMGAAISLTQGATPSASPTYTVRDLGPAWCDWQLAPARTNNRGQVAFTSGDRACRYTDGIGVETLVSDALSYAWDINNRGQVVGWVERNGQWSFFRHTEGLGAQSLVPLNRSFRPNERTLLAEDGSFAGSYLHRAFEYSDANGFAYLPIPSPALSADSGSQGRLLGLVNPDGYLTQRPFLYDAATGVKWLDDQAWAFNDVGQMAITRRTHGDPYWMRREVDGSLTYIGRLGSRGKMFDMNLWGDVVGHHAFVFSDSTGFCYLDDLIDPSLGWELWVAGGINNLGQIAGVGRLGGEYHAFRLDPVNPIPEPASLGLLALGATALLTSARRGRGCRTPL